MIARTEQGVMRQLNIRIPDTRVSMEEAVKAIAEVMSTLPPIGDNEIARIRKNPNLSIFKKWKLIRKIRKG